jgi:hypothetical protein
MTLSIQLQRRLYNSLDIYAPNAFVRHYFQGEVNASCSLKELGIDVGRKVADSDININSAMRRNLGTWLSCWTIYIVAIIGGLQYNINLDLLGGFTLVGAVFIIAQDRIHIREIRYSRADERAIVQLFMTIVFLEDNALRWPDPNFRWQVAEYIEGVADEVALIPFAARSLAPDIAEETLKMGRAKAQAIRQLELWAIRPAAFTFTDLIHELTLALTLMIQGQWHDLPEADGFKPKRNRWPFALIIITVLAITGLALFVAIYDPKANSATYVVIALLAGIALPLGANSGISTGIINQYLQVIGKIMLNG